MNWIIFAIGTAVFISLATIVEKKTLHNQHAMSFSASLAIFNVVISLIYIPFVKFNIGGKAIFFLFLTAIVGSVGFLFLAKGIRHTQVSLSSPLLNFGPAVTALLAFLILGESITSWQIVGIAVIIIGTYVLEVDHSIRHLFEPFKKMINSKYILFIFFAILMYGLGSIIDKYILSAYSINIFTMLFFVHIFMALIYLIMMSVYYGGAKEISGSIKSYWKYILLVSVFITLSRLSHLQAVSLTLVSLVIPIKRLSTLFVTIFGGTFFHESGLKLKIIGCIIMLLGVFFVVFPI